MSQNAKISLYTGPSTRDRPRGIAMLAISVHRPCGHHLRSDHHHRIHRRRDVCRRRRRSPSEDREQP